MGLFDKIKKKKPDAGEGKTTEIFEDAFSAIQVDMVQICLEYVDNRADKIFTPLLKTIRFPVTIFMT